MSLIAILGRQPELAAAELESLLGKDSVKRVFRPNFAELDCEFDLSWANRLGGTMKVTKFLTKLETTDWKIIEKHLVTAAREHSKLVPEGRMTVGISVYGLDVGKRELGSTSLAVKKSIKTTGRSVRLVPNTDLAMNSAQVLFNKLTSERGWELVLIREGRDTLLCQTLWSQDIEGYARRDQARPMRDARVGMLPPKLAQIIVNLATGPLPIKEENVILDPFSGTGVILQEAMLMGYSVYGTDLEPRMIEYTKTNLEWFTEKLRRRTHNPDYKPNIQLETGDAMNHHWKMPVSAVACETFLGRPMSANASKAEIDKEMHLVQQIMKNALQNLAKQLPKGTRCCFAFPAWFTSYGGPNALRLDEPQGFAEQRSESYKKYDERAEQAKTPRFAKSVSDKAGSAGLGRNVPQYVWRLPLVDQMGTLGYTLTSFRHAIGADLIYHREGQVVGRQLITCIKD